MKKTVFTILLIIVLGLAYAQAQQIHIVGYDSRDAIYWINGWRIQLPNDLEYNAIPASITVLGSDVIIVGHIGFHSDGYEWGWPVFWRNGIQTVLPHTEASERHHLPINSFPTGIAISGSDVYIVGSDDSRAAYWLNGRRVFLRVGYRANAIAISGSNIHIVGRSWEDAIYWLNERQIILLPKTRDFAEAKDIAISGSDVYIVGRNYDEYYQNSDAVYWLNGRLIVLPQTGNNASANAIAISGSDVYIVGRDGDQYGNYNAVYWLNGRRIVLPKTGDRASANAIAISGSNVYIVGYDGNDAVYWLNGRRIALTGTNRGGRATSIFITP